MFSKTQHSQIGMVTGLYTRGSSRTDAHVTLDGRREKLYKRPTFRGFSPGHGVRLFERVQVMETTRRFLGIRIWRSSAIISLT